MTYKDFFNLIQNIIDDNSYKGFSNINTPHSESYTESRELFYRGVDWLDLYVKDKSLFKNFTKKILNLKNLFLSLVLLSRQKREIKYLVYLIKKHELNHNFLASVMDISIIKREMAEEKACEEYLSINDPYNEHENDLILKSDNGFYLQPSKKAIERAKKINELTEDYFHKITDEEVRKKLERESIHYFDGVYIHKNWDQWVIDSSMVPFDMQTGWSFNKLSEIISTFLTSLLHHDISVKISNE